MNSQLHEFQRLETHKKAYTQSESLRCDLFWIAYVTCCLMAWVCGGSDLHAQLSNEEIGEDVGDYDPAIETLLSASPTVISTTETQKAWQTVSQWPPDRLNEILGAAEDANPVALNWLRTAIDRMIEQPEFEMPTDLLQTIVQDTRRRYPARRIALELLETADPERVNAMTDSFISDPNSAFRRPAIEKRLAAANALPRSSEQRKQNLQETFQFARDEDQVQAIARLLDEEFGEKPDLAKHFGFILDWHVVGPFPNIDEAGFHAVYPPEKINIEDFDDREVPKDSLEYPVEGKTLRWQKQLAVNDTGEVDLNQSLGKEKEVVGYGVTIFNSESEGPAEIRLRMQNAFKLWLNGELLSSQPIGHTGNSFDQYAIPVTLKAGRNLILIKSCQNKPPQEMEFFDTWHLNVRLCDTLGNAIEEIQE